MKRRMMALVAAAVVVATSAACGPGDSSGGVAETDGLGIDFSFLMEGAESAGASPEQVAILEAAQEAGEISFEVYSEAIDRALRCIREAGGRAWDHGIEEREGVLVRNYSVGVETEAADPVEFWPGMTVHRCIGEHSIAVEIAYTNQPSSIEVQEAFWEQHRGAIVACLRAEGFDDIVGDEPMSDLQGIAGEAVLDGRTEQSCLDVAFAD